MSEPAEALGPDALRELIRSGRIAEADEETRRRYYEYRLSTDPDLRRLIAQAEDEVDRSE